MNWTNLLIIFAMSIAIFFVYSIVNINYLSKLKVSKWTVLVVSLVFLFIGLIIPAYTDNLIIHYIPTAIFVFFFLWYSDLSGLSKIGAPKNKNTNANTIKPKAKPNKLKYANEKDIVKSGNVKEKSKLFKKKNK
ncbi:MAG TPA: hypothetical protein VLM88_01605 [Proteiniclasticum sp.]|nr:hypothetical protein [Proteiniclasticum sp.]